MTNRPCMLVNFVLLSYQIQRAIPLSVDTIQSLVIDYNALYYQGDVMPCCSQDASSCVSCREGCLFWYGCNPYDHNDVEACQCNLVEQVGHQNKFVNALISGLISERHQLKAEENKTSAQISELRNWKSSAEHDVFLDSQQLVADDQKLFLERKRLATENGSTSALISELEMEIASQHYELLNRQRVMSENKTKLDKLLLNNQRLRAEKKAALTQISKLEEKVISLLQLFPMVLVAMIGCSYVVITKLTSRSNFETQCEPLLSETIANKIEEIELSKEKIAQLESIVANKSHEIEDAKVKLKEKQWESMLVQWLMRMEMKVKKQAVGEAAKEKISLMRMKMKVKQEADNQAAKEKIIELESSLTRMEMKVKKEADNQTAKEKIIELESALRMEQQYNAKLINSIRIKNQEIKIAKEKIVEFARIEQPDGISKDRTHNTYCGTLASDGRAEFLMTPRTLAEWYGEPPVPPGVPVFHIGQTPCDSQMDTSCEWTPCKTGGQELEPPLSSESESESEFEMHKFDIERGEEGQEMLQTQTLQNPAASLRAASSVVPVSTSLLATKADLRSRTRALPTLNLGSQTQTLPRAPQVSPRQPEGITSLSAPKEGIQLGEGTPSPSTPRRPEDTPSLSTPKDSIQLRSRTCALPTLNLGSQTQTLPRAPQVSPRQPESIPSLSTPKESIQLGEGTPFSSTPRRPEDTPSLSTAKQSIQLGEGTPCPSTPRRPEDTPSLSTPREGIQLGEGTPSPSTPRRPEDTPSLSTPKESIQLRSRTCALPTLNLGSRTQTLPRAPQVSPRQPEGTPSLSTPKEIQLREGTPSPSTSPGDGEMTGSPGDGEMTGSPGDGEMTPRRPEDAPSLSTPREGTPSSSSGSSQPLYTPRTDPSYLESQVFADQVIYTPRLM